TGEPPMYVIPQLRAMGERRPVGARKELAGRQNIIMTEWGPWDHQGPFARGLQTSGARHVYEFHGIDPKEVTTTGVGVRAGQAAGDKSRPWTLTVESATPGVHGYNVVVNAPDLKQLFTGNLLTVGWDLTVFPWEGPAGPNPPPDLAAWRAAANGAA